VKRDVSVTILCKMTDKEMLDTKVHRPWRQVVARPGPEGVQGVRPPRAPKVRRAHLCL
jgi:hypothetical protein